MASTAIPTQAASRCRTPYQEKGGVWSWLTTVDHKHIGVLYLFTALAFFASAAWRRCSCASS